MSKVKSLREYNLKYKKIKSRLLSFSKKELEEQAKQKNTTIEYILKGRKWLKFGDTYYEVPRLFSFKWLKNLNVGLQIAISSVTSCGVITSVAVPVSIAVINNSIETDENIKFKSSKDEYGDTVIDVTPKNKEYKICTIEVYKGNVLLKPGIDYIIDTKSTSITRVIIKKETHDNIPGRVLINTTLEIKSSISLNKSSVNMDLIKKTTDKLRATVKGESLTVKWKSSDSNICSVDQEGNLEAKNNGNATISATANEKTATCMVTVHTAVTNITVDKPSVALSLKDETTKSTEIVATITPDKSTIRNVTWEIIEGKENISLNSTSCSSGTPITVTAKKNGIAKIKAKAEDKEAIVDVSVETSLEKIDLDCYSKELDLLDGTNQFDIIATTDPIGATIQNINWAITEGDQFISLNKTQSKSGEAITVHAIENGNAKLVASAGGKQATCLITVDTKVSNIILEPNSLSLNMKDHTQDSVTATIEPSQATIKEVSWTIEQGGEFIEQIPEKTSSGSSLDITAKSNGNTKLSVSAGLISKEFNINIDTPLEGLELNKHMINDLDLEKEGYKSTKIKATTIPGKSTLQNITWTVEETPQIGYDHVIELSKNSSISGEDITISAKGNGTAKIKASCGDFTDECTLDIKTAVSKLDFTPQELSIDLYQHKSDSLSATINETAYDKNIYWKVKEGSENIITINGGTKATTTSGQTLTVASINKNGKGYIEVIAGEGERAKTAEFTVTVATDPASITLSETEIEFDLNGETSHNISATILPETARENDIIWQVNNPKDASVITVEKEITKSGETNVVHASTNGEATLVAKAGSKTATCTVKVHTAIESISLDNHNLTIEPTGTQEINISTITPENAYIKQMSFKSSNKNIATVSQDETDKKKAIVTGVANGTVTITASVTDAKGTTVTDSCAVNVCTKATDAKFSVDSIKIAEAETKTVTLNITPTSASIKTITFASSNEEICTVTQTSENSKTATVKGILDGNATITATVTDEFGTVFSPTLPVTVKTVLAISGNHAVEIDNGCTYTVNKKNTTFSMQSGSDLASIDSSTGKLSISTDGKTKGGTIIIKASCTDGQTATFESQLGSYSKVTVYWYTTGNELHKSSTGISGRVVLPTRYYDTSRKQFFECSKIDGHSGQAFSFCRSLTSFYISAGFENLVADCFEEDFAMQSITFASNSKITTLCTKCFNYCGTDMAFVIPSFITTLQKEIWGLCYYGHGHPSSITFENTTGWKYIGTTDACDVSNPTTNATHFTENSYMERTNGITRI